MSDKTLPRPPQTTFCGGAVIAGSVAILLLAFGRMSSLGSIEAQESAQLFVDSLPDDLGLTADGWQSVLRVLCVVSGGLSVVTGYLGWLVLQRDKRARLALGVLAPVVLVAGTAVAEIIPAVMVVAIVMLWRQPSRDWFDGRKPAPVPPRATAPAAVPAGPAGPAGPTAPGGAAGAAGTPSSGTPVPVWTPPSTARPGGVSGAVAVTVITSVVVVATLVLGLFVLLGDRARFEQTVADEIARQPAYEDLDISASTITGVAIGVIVVFVLWALVAIALAVLTARGNNAARITLVVSAISAALASLIGALAIFPLVVTGACIAVAVLLLRADATAWFAARKS